MTTLSEKAISSSKLINQQDCKSRSIAFEEIGEFGFSLILYWNQIESLIKLIRYYDRVSEGWPDKLHFLRASWKPLKLLYDGDHVQYKLVFGKEQSCLCGLRDLIAHQSINISATEHNKLIFAARWAIANLIPLAPNLERVRDRKRRSEAQFNRRKNFT